MARYTDRKVNGSRFCEITIEYESRDGGPPRLSICGTEGRVVTPVKARKEALSYWTSYFDDSPEEIVGLNKRFNKRLTSSRGAAKFVLETDGALHGLDVHAETDDRVFVGESWGQIVETIREWFPEHADLLPFHLNDMKAGAPDQEAALDSAPRDWWRKLPGGKYGPSYYEHACMALAIGGLYVSQYDGDIHVTGRGKMPGRGYIYGRGWVAMPLPEEIDRRVRALVAADE